MGLLLLLLRLLEKVKSGAVSFICVPPASGACLAYRRHLVLSPQIMTQTLWALQSPEIKLRIWIETVAFTHQGECREKPRIQAIFLLRLWPWRSRDTTLLATRQGSLQGQKHFTCLYIFNFWHKAQNKCWVVINAIPVTIMKIQGQAGTTEDRILLHQRSSEDQRRSEDQRPRENTQFAARPPRRWRAPKKHWLYKIIWSMTTSLKHKNKPVLG